MINSLCRVPYQVWDRPDPASRFFTGLDSAPVFTGVLHRDDAVERIKFQTADDVRLGKYEIFGQRIKIVLCLLKSKNPFVKRFFQFIACKSMKMKIFYGNLWEKKLRKHGKCPHDIPIMLLMWPESPAVSSRRGYRSGEWIDPRGIRSSPV